MKMNGMYFGSNRVMGAKSTSRERFAKLFIHWNNGGYDEIFFSLQQPCLQNRYHISSYDLLGTKVIKSDIKIKTEKS